MTHFYSVCSTNANNIFMSSVSIVLPHIFYTLGPKPNNSMNLVQKSNNISKAKTFPLLYFVTVHDAVSQFSNKIIHRSWNRKCFYSVSSPFPAWFSQVSALIILVDFTNMRHLSNFKGFALKCFTCESVSNPKCADLSDKVYQPQECVAENILAQGAGFFSQLGIGGNTNGNKEPFTPVCMKVVTKNGEKIFHFYSRVVNI